jgi:hypothetical protein
MTEGVLRQHFQFTANGIQPRLQGSAVNMMEPKQRHWPELVKLGLLPGWIRLRKMRLG